MAISESLSLSKLFCPIRKTWIAATPEEEVRQRLLHDLISLLGYPHGLVAVEKELKQMPHLRLNPVEPPLRRADILCFGKEIHPDYALYPLLLIECKAVKLTRKVINQVTGYNHYLKAYFIAVANQEEVQTGWYDKEKGDYTFIPRLPGYQELLKTVIPTHKA